MKTPWATDVALNLSRLMEKTWTLQKFAPGADGDANPVLTDRRNVVVVADEAHRSQYGFGETLDRHGRLRSGLAKHMRDTLPGATYLGFTGTPIESNDKSTRSVFGDCIDVYDLTRAVEDGATLKIFYESRLAKIDLSDDDLAALDELADEITETVEEDAATAAKSRWSRLEAIVGADSRLDLIARDIVEHWEKRREALFGTGMIVTMSRRIALRLYEKIIALRPDWHSDDPAKGKIKVAASRGRGRVLRRHRAERCRRTRAWRRGTQGDRPEACQGRAGVRHHRLESQGLRPRYHALQGASPAGTLRLPA